MAERTVTYYGATITYHHENTNYPDMGLFTLDTDGGHHIASGLDLGKLTRDSADMGRGDFIALIEAIGAQATEQIGSLNPSVPNADHNRKMLDNTKRFTEAVVAALKGK